MPDLAAPAAYAVIWALVAVDAFLPVVPTQLLMISAGWLATHHDLHLAAVVAAGAAGAFSGDFACYQLGRRTGTLQAPKMLARLVRRPMKVQLRHGLVAILVCRFVPGGRFLTCFHAGQSNEPGPAFVTRIAIAGLAWAAYGAVVGWIGGDAITHSQWIPLAIAAAGAAVFATVGWLGVLVSPSHHRPTNSTPL